MSGQLGTPSRDVLPKHRKAATPKSFLRELPILLLVAVVLALVIKTFFVQAFFIPSGSMEDTLQVGDRVLVNKLVYRFRDIHRGDVVVFNGLDSFVQDTDARIAPPPRNAFERVGVGVRRLIGLGDPGEKDFIKRVIGVPGDTVACCTKGQLTVNGKPLDEAGYVFEDDRQPFGPVTVAPGKIWVMGDHRSQSSDSRANGQVPASRVLGRAVVVVWPASHAKGLRAPATFEHRPRVRAAARVSRSPLTVAGVITFIGNGVRRRRRRSRRHSLRGLPGRPARAVRWQGHDR
jgi:signal peptidase I